MPAPLQPPRHTGASRPPTSTDGPGREHVAGYALALYLLSGSWSLARVAGVEPSPIWEPRTWAVMMLVALALLPARARLRTTRSAIVPEVAWLGFSALAINWAPDMEFARVQLIDVALLIATSLSLHRLLAVGRVEQLAASLRLGLLLILLGLMAAGLAGGLGGGRLAVLGGGPNVFGRNMGMLCIVALERALFGGGGARAGRSGMLAFVMVACIAAGLVSLSGSRGAMISTFAVASLLLVLGRARLGRRLAIVLIVLGSFIAMLLFTPLGPRVIESFELRFVELLIGERYVSARDRIYMIALTDGAERPILGHGLASFAATTPWPYTHNIFLDAWYETGMIGVVLLTLYVARSGWELLRLGSDGRELWLSLALLIFVGSQFSGGRYDARALLVFAAMTLALPRARRAIASSRTPTRSSS